MSIVIFFLLHEKKKIGTEEAKQNAKYVTYLYFQTEQIKQKILEGTVF